MAGSGAVDIFLVYQFLKRLAQPFTSWDAYKEGVIDREGNIITPKNKLHNNRYDHLRCLML